MNKFIPGDLCVIKSKTSYNKGRVVEIIGYTQGRYSDILRVRIRSNEFNIKEDSLKLASKYDIIRNLSDKQLKRFLRSLSERSIW